MYMLDKIPNLDNMDIVLFSSLTSWFNYMLEPSVYEFNKTPNTTSLGLAQIFIGMVQLLWILKALTLLIFC
jgi:hypothetical protein